MRVVVSPMLRARLDSVRIWEAPLDGGLGLTPSPGTNRRARVVEVLAVSLSKLCAVVLTVGSSTSFSGLRRGCLLLDAGGGAEGVVSVGLGFARRLPPAFVRAAREPELLEDTAALKEARAVLADTEAVGGPDTKIERWGGSNEVVGTWSPCVGP